MAVAFFRAMRAAPKIPIRNLSVMVEVGIVCVRVLFGLLELFSIFRHGLPYNVTVRYTVL